MTTVTDKMVKAAREELHARFIHADRSAMRAALKAAGVGDLINALRPFALWHRKAVISSDFNNARAVLEKLGVKL